MSDYISREKAYQQMLDLQTRKKERYLDIDDVHKVLRKMPSADVRENIKGEWIKTKDQYGTYHFTCSKCGNDIATKSDAWDDNFCSECGADMRGK